MRTKTVDELIKDLLQLRLVETALLRQLEAARRLETGRATVPHPDLNLIVVGDRVKITNRVRNPKGGEVTKRDQLEAARRLETGRATVPHPDLNLIVVGDRVKITNRVRNPKGGEVTKRDRLGTVTRLHEGKVFFTTDNGTNTWRLPRNLLHLT